MPYTVMIGAYSYHHYDGLSYLTTILSLQYMGEKDATIRNAVVDNHGHLYK